MKIRKKKNSNKKPIDDEASYFTFVFFIRQVFRNFHLRSGNINVQIIILKSLEKPSMSIISIVMMLKVVYLSYS